MSEFVSGAGGREFEQLFEVLKSKQQTVGFAESCTGGLLAAEMAKFSGISAYFMGGIVSYSNQAKVDVLSVSKDDIERYGAVSEEVALSMARGACKCLKTNWSAAITGIAGPGGGQPDKPVGTVCFAWVGPGLERSQKTRFDGNRWDIQNSSARFAAQILTEAIGSYKVE